MDQVTRGELRETRTYRIGDQEFEAVAAAAEAFGLRPSTFVRRAAVAAAKLAAEEGVVQQGGPLDPQQA